MIRVRVDYIPGTDEGEQRCIDVRIDADYSPDILEDIVNRIVKLADRHPQVVADAG